MITWKAALIALAAIVLGLIAAVESEAGEASPGAAVLAKPRYYVVLYQAGPAWKASLPMAKQDLRQHALYYKGLTDEGRVLGGGRFEDMDGGMAILRANSLEEAQQIIKADPAVTSGVFSADLRVWTPRFYDPALAPPAN